MMCVLLVGFRRVEQVCCNTSMKTLIACEAKSIRIIFLTLLNHLLLQSHTQISGQIRWKLLENNHANLHLFLPASEARLTLQ